MSVQNDTAQPIRVERGLFAELKRPAETEVAVYRIYNAADGLLYVGITNDTTTRWIDHKMTKSWWTTEAHAYDVRWYPTRDIAAAKEQRAIQNEHPRHNTVHAVLPRRDVVPKVPGAYSTGEIARRFRISPDTIRVLSQQPEFPRRLTLPPPYRKGKRYAIEEIERYFALLRPVQAA